MKKLMGVLMFGVILGLASGVSAAPTFFNVFLDGAQEVPGPGDPDGTGIALLIIDPEIPLIDWGISVFNIDIDELPLTGAHIHVAPVGEAGPIIFDFMLNLEGTEPIDPDLASAIVANPELYYINLHNAVYPQGAIRGQLGFETTPVIPVPSAISLVMIGLAGLRLARRKPL